MHAQLGATVCGNVCVPVVGTGDPQRGVSACFVRKKKKNQERSAGIHVKEKERETVTDSSCFGLRCVKENSKKSDHKLLFSIELATQLSFFFWRETKDSVEFVAASYGLASV